MQMGNEIKRNVMVGLQTLGSTNFAPVVAIAGTRFSLEADDEAMEMFYQPVSLESCMALGMRAECEAILWFAAAPELVRQQLAAPDAMPLAQALDAFTDWHASRPDDMWSYTGRIDLGILWSAYKACGKEVPWRQQDERCYRTVAKLPQAAAVPLVCGSMQHALHDAVNYAEHLQAIYAVLRGDTTK
jgi:hypothetical protein